MMLMANMALIIEGSLNVSEFSEYIFYHFDSPIYLSVMLEDGYQVGSIFFLEDKFAVFKI